VATEAAARSLRRGLLRDRGTGIGNATSIAINMQTIKTIELDNVTGAGGSSGIKHPLSSEPAITGTASPSLAKQLSQIKRPGFDFVVAK
jgi:hypothetical protein